jgi:hypothetical protein
MFEILKISTNSWNYKIGMNWKNPLFPKNLERNDKNLEISTKLFNLQN